MENVDGKKFIEIICQRLEDEGKLLYDSNIVMKIVTLTNRELNEIVSLRGAKAMRDGEIKHVSRDSDH